MTGKDEPPARRARLTTVGWRKRQDDALRVLDALISRCEKTRAQCQRIREACNAQANRLLDGMRMVDLEAHLAQGRPPLIAFIENARAAEAEFLRFGGLIRQFRKEHADVTAFRRTGGNFRYLQAICEHFRESTE